jgi:BASS family bile acid:Na+ symporter
VVLTSCSTILACVLTPLLVMLLAGSLVPVNAASMGGDVLKVVLLPVTAGMLLAEVLPATIKRYLSSIMPAAAVLTSTCLTSAALGSCASLIMGSGSTAMQPLLAVCRRRCTFSSLSRPPDWMRSSALLSLSSLTARATVAWCGQVVLTHAFGFLLGYQLSKRLRFDPETNRTVSIEVGMQSSVMALALAAKHFSDVSSQLPCALSAVVMNVMGAGLAFFFRWRVRQSTLAALRRRTDAAE